MADSRQTLILAGLILALLPAARAAVPVAGNIASVSGSALLRRGNAGTGEPASSHSVLATEPIYQGDVVQTGESGSVKMVFSDDSIIDIGPKTMFKVETFHSQGEGSRIGVFTVLYGRIRALVSKALTPDSKFEVKTANASMGVRGTEFIVSAPGDISRSGNSATIGGSSSRTDVTVISGHVALALPRGSGPPLSIGPNMQASAFAGMKVLPKAEVLNMSQIGALAQQARVADNTFVRTVSMDKGVRNESAPRAATSVAAAVNSVGTGSASVSDKEDTKNVKGIGTFSVLDSLTDTPATLLPGNFQTVTVVLH